MRLLIQRVSRACVRVDGKITGKIDRGLLVFIGIAVHDTRKEADYLVPRLTELRIFPDAQGKMNLSATDVKAGLLLVSQFTLYAETNRGRRPGFERAAPLTQARELYEYVVAEADKTGLVIQTGVFQAHMDVELVNDGPVTLMLEA